MIGPDPNKDTIRDEGSAVDCYYSVFTASTLLTLFMLFIYYSNFFTLHNVYIIQYDSPVVKTWNPKYTFPKLKKSLWGYFSYIGLGKTSMKKNIFFRALPE